MLQGLAGVIAPLSLLTAVAIYFGYTRVAAFDEYFGLQPSVVGYSTRDYVFNSLDPLFLPVVIVLVCLIGLGLAHALVKHVHEQGDRTGELRRSADWSIGVGVTLFVIGALAVTGGFPFHVPYLIGTLFPAVGVVLVAYGIGLRRRLQGLPHLPVGLRVLVGLLVALCLFWAAGLYAGTVGHNEAKALAAHLDRLPGVVVYSKDSLGIPAKEGLTTTIASGTADPYVYTGFRVFTAKDGMLFLIPSGWQEGSGTLIEVPSTDVESAFTPASTGQGANAYALGGGGLLPTPSPPAVLEPPPHPQIRIVLGPKTQPIRHGQAVGFRIDIKNVGSGNLRGIRVIDRLVPDCNATPSRYPFLASLSPGKSVTYRCSLDNVARRFTNVVTTVGVSPAGVHVTAAARAAVS